MLQNVEFSSEESVHHQKRASLHEQPRLPYRLFRMLKLCEPFLDRLFPGAPRQSEALQPAILSFRSNVRTDSRACFSFLLAPRTGPQGPSLAFKLEQTAGESAVPGGAD